MSSSVKLLLRNRPTAFDISHGNDNIVVAAPEGLLFFHVNGLGAPHHIINYEQAQVVSQLRFHRQSGSSESHDSLAALRGGVVSLWNPSNSLRPLTSFLQPPSSSNAFVVDMEWSLANSSLLATCGSGNGGSVAHIWDIRSNSSLPVNTILTAEGRTPSNLYESSSGVEYHSLDWCESDASTNNLLMLKTPSNVSLFDLRKLGKPHHNQVHNTPLLGIDSVGDSGAISHCSWCGASSSFVVGSCYTDTIEWWSASSLSIEIKQHANNLLHRSSQMLSTPVGKALILSQPAYLSNPSDATPPQPAGDGSDLPNPPAAASKLSTDGSKSLATTLMLSGYPRSFSMGSIFTPPEAGYEESPFMLLTRFANNSNQASHSQFGPSQQLNVRSSAGAHPYARQQFADPYGSNIGSRIISSNHQVSNQPPALPAEQAGEAVEETVPGLYNGGILGMKWGTPGRLIPPTHGGLELLVFTDNGLLQAIKITPEVTSKYTMSRSVGKDDSELKRDVFSAPTLTSPVRTTAGSAVGGGVGGASEESAGATAVHPTISAHPRTNRRHVPPPQFSITHPLTTSNTGTSAPPAAKPSFGLPQTSHLFPTETTTSHDFWGSVEDEVLCLQDNLDNTLSPYGIPVADQDARLTISRIDQYARQVMLEVTMDADSSAPTDEDGGGSGAQAQGVVLTVPKPPSHRHAAAADTGSVSLVISYPPHYPDAGLPSFTVRAQAGGSKIRHKDFIDSLTKELTDIAENICNERNTTEKSGRDTGLTSLLLSGRSRSHDAGSMNANSRLLLLELSRCFRNRVSQAWRGSSLSISSPTVSSTNPNSTPLNELNATDTNSAAITEKLVSLTGNVDTGASTEFALLPVAQQSTGVTEDNSLQHQPLNVIDLKAYRIFCPVSSGGIFSPNGSLLCFGGSCLTTVDVAKVSKGEGREVSKVREISKGQGRDVSKVRDGKQADSAADHKLPAGASTISASAEAARGILQATLPPQLDTDSYDDDEEEIYQLNLIRAQSSGSETMLSSASAQAEDKELLHATDASLHIPYYKTYAELLVHFREEYFRSQQRPGPSKPQPPRTSKRQGLFKSSKNKRVLSGDNSSESSDAKSNLDVSFDRTSSSASINSVNGTGNSNSSSNSCNNSITSASSIRDDEDNGNEDLFGVRFTSPMRTHNADGVLPSPLTAMNFIPPESLGRNTTAPTVVIAFNTPEAGCMTLAKLYNVGVLSGGECSNEDVDLLYGSLLSSKLLSPLSEISTCGWDGQSTALICRRNAVVVLSLGSSSSPHHTAVKDTSSERNAIALLWNLAAIAFDSRSRKLSSTVNVCEEEAVLEEWLRNALGGRLLKTLLEQCVQLGDTQTAATLICMLDSCEDMVDVLCLDDSAAAANRAKQRCVVNNILNSYMNMLSQWGLLCTTLEVGKRLSPNFAYLAAAPCTYSTLASPSIGSLKDSIIQGNYHTPQSSKKAVALGAMPPLSKSLQLQKNRDGSRFANDYVFSLGIRCMYCSAEINCQSSPADLRAASQHQRRPWWCYTCRAARPMQCSICHERMTLPCAIIQPNQPVGSGSVGGGGGCFCPMCGHGGHINHMKQWFSVSDECPAGCGCYCRLSAFKCQRQDSDLLGTSTSVPGPPSGVGYGGGDSSGQGDDVRSGGGQDAASLASQEQSSGGSKGRPLSMPRNFSYGLASHATQATAPNSKQSRPQPEILADKNTKNQILNAYVRKHTAQKYYKQQQHGGDEAGKPKLTGNKVKSVPFVATPRVDVTPFSYPDSSSDSDISYFTE